jgi:hypothetical protein
MQLAFQMHSRCGEMGKTAARWGKRGLIALFGLYALYLVAMNGLITSKLLIGWINDAQKNVRLDYSSAYSLFPMHVVAQGLSLRVQDSAVEFHLGATSARTRIGLLALFDQTFEANGGGVEGGSIRLRVVRPLDALCTQATAHVPPIPGLTEPLADRSNRDDCLTQTETAFSPSPTPSPKEKLWRMRLDGVDGQLQELWIEQFRTRGEIGADLDVWFWPMGELEIKDSALTVRTATMTSDRTLISKLRADVALSVDQAQLDKDELAQIFTGLAGHLDLEADIESFGLLDSYLSGTEWISFKESRGHLVAKIEVDHGNILEGTAVALDPAKISVTAHGHRARGDGLARWAVSKDGDQRWARLDVGLSRFELRATDDSKDIARGRNLGLTLIAKSPTIHAPLEDVSLDVELESLKFPSLAGLNRYFPKSGLQIREGTATLDGALTIKHGHRVERGRAHLVTDSVQASYVDLALQGVADLTLAIPSADLAKGELDIDGTTFTVRDGRVLERTTKVAKTEGWWAKLTLKRGSLRIEPATGQTESPILSTIVVAELSSIRPILAVYGADGRLPGIIRGFDPGSAKGTFELSVSPERLILDRLQFDAGDLELQANLHQRNERASGGLLIGILGLRAGLEIEGPDSKLVLLDPTANYQRRAQQRRSKLEAVAN